MGKHIRREVFSGTRWDSFPLNCTTEVYGIDFNSIPNLKERHKGFQGSCQGEAQDLQPCVKNDGEKGDTEDVEELEEAEEPHCECGQ